MDADRIAVAVPADRRPGATTRVAAAFARQAGLALEFVDAAPGGHGPTDELRRRCRVAARVGVASVGWHVLDGPAEAIGPYVTWSGARLCCIGCRGRGRVGAYGPAGVPMLLVGPLWRPGDLRRVVVGVHGPAATADQVTAVAAALADRLGAELTLIEVVRARWGAADIPACAHVQWAARRQPGASFDTVSADRTDEGIGRLLDVATVAVVGRSTHHRRPLGGVAGRLAARAPGPVVAV